MQHAPQAVRAHQCGLSQEMLDIVNYRKESNLLFDVGVADALS